MFVDTVPQQKFADTAYFWWRNRKRLTCVVFTVIVHDADTAQEIYTCTVGSNNDSDAINKLTRASSELFALCELTVFV